MYFVLEKRQLLELHVADALGAGPLVQLLAVLGTVQRGVLEARVALLHEVEEVGVELLAGPTAQRRRGRRGRRAARCTSRRARCEAPLR